MSAEQNLNPQDLELLSAYLDNMLNDAERSALEARLANDAVLRAELDGLRATIALINGLPTLKAPRNFTLTPAMVKSRTETGAPQLVKSKTETGRIIRFPISAVMSAAASFVFILVGMILVFGSVNQPSMTKAPAPSNDVALMFTPQPVTNQTTFGGMGVQTTDEVFADDMAFESVVVQENQPASPIDESGDALYAVPAMAESLPLETQSAQDVMPMQSMPTQSLTARIIKERWYKLLPKILPKPRCDKPLPLVRLWL
ncbi:MAG: hypothetical protein MUE54_15030 [Anaerolineae bacterium]|nr:hypothetical protein [Anaerolineae bacterium]